MRARDRSSEASPFIPAFFREPSGLPARFILQVQMEVGSVLVCH